MLTTGRAEEKGVGKGTKRSWQGLGASDGAFQGQRRKEVRAIGFLLRFCGVSGQELVYENISKTREAGDTAEECNRPEE